MAFVSDQDDKDVMEQEEKEDQRSSILNFIRQCYTHHQIEDGLEQKSLSYITRYFEKLQYKDNHQKRQEVFQKMVEKKEDPKPLSSMEYLKEFKLENDSIQQQREYYQTTNPKLKYRNQNQKRPYSQIDLISLSKLNRHQEKAKAFQKPLLKMEESDLSKGDIYQQSIEEKKIKIKPGPQPKVKESSLDDEWVQQKIVKNKSKSKSQPKQSPDTKNKLQKETEKKFNEESQSRINNLTTLYLDGKKVQKNKMKPEKLKPRTFRVKQDQRQGQYHGPVPEKKKFVKKPKVLMRKIIGEGGFWTMDQCIRKLPEYIKEGKARTQKYLNIMNQILYPDNLTPFEYFLKINRRLARFNLFPTGKYVINHFELSRQDNLNQIQDFLDSILKYIKIKDTYQIQIFENKSKFHSIMRNFKKCQIEQKNHQNKTQYDIRKIWREAENITQKFIHIVEKGKINQARFDVDISDEQKRNKMVSYHYFQELFQDLEENRQMVCKEENIMLEKPFEVELVRSSDQEKNDHN